MRFCFRHHAQPLCLAVLMSVPLLALPAWAAPPTDGPSVLVRVTRLEKGSLPRLVTAYGSIGAGAAAQHVVMAPLAARIETVAVRQGEAVKQGEPLLRLAPAPQVAAAYAEARSAQAVARERVQRTRRMLAQHLATAQQLADAEKAAADAKAILVSLEAQGAGGSRVLRAPFAAIVVTLSAAPGALVAEGAPLLVLARRSGLVLRAGVLPEEAANIAPGDPALVTPLGASSDAPGKVLLVGSVVEAASGLVPVEIALPEGHFLAGQAARASITVGKVEGYVVPHQAVLVSATGAPYVVQVVSGSAKKIAVEILESAGARDVIAGPLDGAAPLVLEGNYQLEDGMKVRFAGPVKGRP